MSDRQYEHPLVSRYSSSEMSYLFSPHKKFSTWRRLWLALAEAEAALGLPITGAQLDAMRATLTDLDLEAAARYERELRHDVMAHVHAWGDQVPAARPIIHLGATSCYVGDNTDLVVMREGLDLLLPKLANVIEALSGFARQHAAGLEHEVVRRPTPLHLPIVIFNLR